MNQKWVRLDNAATIYPAAKRRRWTALFRLSVRLTEPVDPYILEDALKSTLRRCKYFASVLHRGMFWYYLEQSDDLPPIQPDVRNPLTTMHPRGNGGFSFRVRYYESTIAIEIFHVLTDGTGGRTLLSTLTAEYLRLRYGADIPRDDVTLLDCQKPPKAEETEDSFVRCAGRAAASRAESGAFHLTGEPVRAEKTVNIITGSVAVSEISSRAKAMGVSVNEYLTALLILSFDAIQRRRVHNVRRLRPVKITVPINLRPYFGSNTLRNFSSISNPGIDPRLGEYTLEETAQIVHHFMAMDLTEKSLRAKFSGNVITIGYKGVRMAPLFIKNFVMKRAFLMYGDKKSSTCFSNLGRLEYPEEMSRYIRRADFILGPLTYNKVAVAAIGYGNTLNISFTRTLRDAELEREFFRRMVKLGIHVKIESNQRW